MKRSAFPIRIACVIGALVLLVLVWVGPAGALPALYQTTPEPTPRPTATTSPYIDLQPNVGIVGNDNQTQVTGYFFTPNAPVEFLFDDAVPMEVLAGVFWNPDGTFSALLRIPPQALAGSHRISATQPDGTSASAIYTLIDPTPTIQPTPSNTLPPSDTPLPTDTPSPTTSPTASPTLRPVTPMVTITPIPPTRQPTRVATKPPAATRTSTPRPGTATSTPTPSITPTPTDTPGPGTPSATPEQATVTPTPEKEISDTGSGWGTIFLWGFVLAGLLVVFRLLRVRGLRGQS